MAKRRVWAIGLTIAALIALFASTSVIVDVVPSAQSEEAREAAFALARAQGRRTRIGLTGLAVLLLVPAVALWCAELRGRDGGEQRAQNRPE